MPRPNLPTSALPALALLLLFAPASLGAEPAVPTAASEAAEPGPAEPGSAILPAPDRELELPALLAYAEQASPEEEAATGNAGGGDRDGRFRTSLRVIGGDYRALVSRPRIFRLLGGLAVGGALANTDADADLYEEYRDWSDGSGLADLSSAAKGPGEAAVVLPLFIVPSLFLGLEEEPEQTAVGRWWRRAGRAYLAGAPALYYLQQLTGGERPGDPGGSSWKPFEGNHGISGHAFMGAVPFLTAARQTDNRWLKAGAVALSLLPAWSRLEDGKHFPSQVALGWFLAWEVTGAVAEASEEHADAKRVAVLPLVDERGTGLAVHVSLP